jgi:hypothetical protein
VPGARADIVSGLLPLAAASGLVVVLAAVVGAVLLLLFLFRAEKRGEAEARSEAERAERDA